ncbi:DUF1963 domain-containing protein [Rhizobium sp. MHM7A]|uniref:DUF1963 domain-containing protein n=1 Tax=Rhizobium sp. MHM7A TaxID=2583233 RepID=UPI0011072267|nr:DUF1963 domain-containing protein [Rhizobium sp. MHM7A]TLX16177.1 DUF1963 domain-containing protein [Rhizobium sp. MHM7A]
MHASPTLKEKIDAIASCIIERLIKFHIRECASKPITYEFKEHFDRRDAELLFEQAIDPLIPAAHDVINTLAPIPDVRLDGRALKNNGIRHLTIKWWNVDAITFEGEMEVSALRKMVADARLTRIDSIQQLGLTYLDLITEIEGVRIPAYGPICLQNSEGEATDSRYSGRPFVSLGFQWPKDQAARPMKFLAQFREDQLPKEVRETYGLGTSLISIFTSVQTQDDEEFDAETPSRDFAVFRFPLSGEGHLAEQTAEGQTPAMAIVGWKAVQDTPSWPDLLSGELSLSAAAQDALHAVNDGVLGCVNARRIGIAVDEADQAFVARNVDYFWGVGNLPPTAAFRGASLETFAENKLCGWPLWSRERLWMTSDGKRMHPLLHIAVGDGDFANLGLNAIRTAHLFIDPKNPDIMKITPWTLSAL